MKINIFNASGNKEKEIATALFDGEIRQDIVQKIVEAEKEKQAYAPYLWAGMDISASGNVKHNRHVWKTDRGKGVGRFPKKRMSDKGDRFVWVGAVVPGMRGGRRAHPPRVLRAGFKINAKEKRLGLMSALAMVASNEMIKKKYDSLKNMEIKIKLPIIIDSAVLKLKSKDFFKVIGKILGEEMTNIAIQEKSVRAGVGKMRNRRYKQNAGMLLIIGNKQEKKISGIEVKKVWELKLGDIAMNGARLVMFTDEAVKELEVRTGLAGGKK